MNLPDNQFIAFFSYVQRNDEHDKGRLTVIRKLLEAELWAQTGKDLQVFQDKEDIEWGDNWKERITKALDSCVFLIAIVTPSYLESKACIFEFEYFLKRESISHHNDLILPILYIDTEELKNPQNSVAIEISKRQWIDLRESRFVSLQSAKFNKKIEGLAKQLRDMLFKQKNTYIDEVKSLSFPSDWQTSWQPSVPDEVIPSISIKLEERSERKSRITVVLKSTGDVDRDRRRIKTIYGNLISFHGSDLFSLQFLGGDKPNKLIDFPNDTTRICPELLVRLEKLMGEKSWIIEELEI